MRRSTTEKIAYNEIPITARIIKPEKTNGTLKEEEAINIMLPIPLFEATVSAITEPTKDSVIATFKDAKKYGIERGKPTFHRISQRLALSYRITSSSTGSTVAIPVDTLTTMGKMQMIIAVRMAGTVPAPNHKTKIGTTATLGMEEIPTNSG